MGYLTLSTTSGASSRQGHILAIHLLTNLNKYLQADQVSLQSTFLFARSIHPLKSLYMISIEQYIGSHLGVTFVSRITSLFPYVGYRFGGVALKND